MPFAARIESPNDHGFGMGGGLNGARMPFEERRRWRLLLARLHPDAGGDEEIFLLASALRPGMRGGPILDPGTTVKPSGTYLRGWRTTMGCWASDNRNTLRRNRLRRGEPSRP